VTRESVSIHRRTGEAVAKVSQRQRLNHSSSRTLAALLGTVPVAVGLGVTLTLLLPLARAERYLIGNYSVFPAWVALSLAVFLAPSARRAWLVLLAFTLLLAAAVLLARCSGRGLDFIEGGA
jgi:hypothetical protein